MRAAASLAQINVLSIVTEPTAAVVASQNDVGLEPGHVFVFVFVFRLGREDSDLSVVEVRGSKYTVKASTRITNFCEMAMEDILIKELAERFKRKHNLDFTTDRTSTRILREHSHRAIYAWARPGPFKIPFQIPSFFGGKDLDEVIPVAWFGDEIDPLLENLSEALETILKVAGLETGEITSVLLVGSDFVGLQCILDKFECIKIIRRKNPRHEVARGACFVAKALSTKKPFAEVNLAARAAHVEGFRGALGRAQAAVRALNEQIEVLAAQSRQLQAQVECSDDFPPTDPATEPAATRTLNEIASEATERLQRLAKSSEEDGVIEFV
jgi:molecular chaperone DnaK (HSP70)